MRDKNIYVAGHNGMVGSAIVKALEEIHCKKIIVKNRQELDLTNQLQVSNFFNEEKIDYVILAAAKVGGIHANNTYPADFIYENLMIEANIIHQSYLNGIERLLFLGSSCIYPKLTKQPMKEEALLTGRLEPTNEPYAIAKIAGIKLCESYNRQYGTDYRSAMPTNLYGPNDNFHPENSHVIPALIRRFHEAKISNAQSVTIWGTGAACREFLYVDDMADASLHLLGISKELYKASSDQMVSHINVGCGIDVSINDLSALISKVVGFRGTIVFDESMPDGAPKKLMDSTKLKSLGWKPTIDLEQGLKLAYSWYLKNCS